MANGVRDAVLVSHNLMKHIEDFACINKKFRISRKEHLWRKENNGFRKVQNLLFGIILRKNSTKTISLEIHNATRISS